MIKYKKKPEVVEAIFWDGKNDLEVENFIDDKLFGYGDNLVAYYPRSEQYRSKLLYVHGSGIMTIPVNSYVIKKANGEYEYCDQDAFKEMYEKINENEINK